MTDVGVEKKSRGRVCKTGGGEGKGGYIRGSRGGGTVNVEEEEGGCKSERGGGGVAIREREVGGGSPLSAA